jgi:surface antigen
VTLQEFISNYNGQTNVGDTEANKGQCVGLIEVWLDAISAGSHIWGNANDLMGNANSDYFDVIANTPTGVPAAGDVICWSAGFGGSAVGHTAIVESADVNTFTVFEQNDRIGGGNGACRTHTFSNYDHVQGWIHPRVLNKKEQDMISADQVKDLYRVFLGREASQDEANSWVGEWATAFYGIKDSDEGQAFTAKLVGEARDAESVPGLQAEVTELQNKVAELSTTPVVEPTKPTTPPIIVPVTKEVPVEPLQTRLTSRKFWIAVVAAAGFALHGDAAAAVAVILGYFGVNVLDK